MNPERLQLKGLLAESKKNFRSLDTEASGLIVLLRSYLNPYEETLKLDAEKIIIMANRLNEVVTEMKALSVKIKKMEIELE